MATRVSIEVPLNRIEGDLEIRAEIEDGRVVDAFASGTMYRGFERLLVGRGAMDGLVLTPRVCGICSHSHLLAAARALDATCGAVPPPNAVRIRNVSLMVEIVQSDMRHACLIFAADFVNPCYEGQPLFAEAIRRYRPFQGEMVLEVVRSTRDLLEVAALLGGQWPHSSFMVPGGVVSCPNAPDLLDCRIQVKRFRTWYEQRVLGCSLERWLEIRDAASLESWLEENPAHRDGEVGFLLRYGRAIGLHRLGGGHDAFLSYGGLDLPTGTRLAGTAGDRLVPAGFHAGGRWHPFLRERVTEDVSHSWFEDDGHSRHPFEGQTVPTVRDGDPRRYSWAKSPRYQGVPAETGPLAERLVAGDPLFVDLVAQGGVSALVRHLARVVRSAHLLPAMETWLAEAADGGPCYASPGVLEEGEGCGLVQAPRGALGHWVRIEDGRLTHYQIITPTAWNASPRDVAEVRGPVEEALVGTQVQDLAHPVELGHVVRSFDCCLVCTVHALHRGRPMGRVTLGAGW